MPGPAPFRLPIAGTGRARQPVRIADPLDRITNLVHQSQNLEDEASKYLQGITNNKKKGAQSLFSYYHGHGSKARIHQQNTLQSLKEYALKAGLTNAGHLQRVDGR
jgi:hypothetical protein